MTSAKSIFWSAADAHRALNHRYATLLFRQAAEQAREYRDELLWFKATVWAAESQYSMDNFREALSLVLAARAEEPPGTGFDHWLCRKLHFKVSLGWEPVNDNLACILSELEQFSDQNDVPKHDLHILRAELSKQRGRWDEALVHFERAVAEYDSTAGGATKFWTAYLAVDCCLILQRLNAAEDWIKAIYDKSEWDEGWDKAIRSFQASSRLSLARARHAPYSEMSRLLRELEELSSGIDESILCDKIRNQRLRVAALDPAGGDPIRSTHPSRNVSRDFSSKQLNCHSRFDQTLLILDYRLACLRFAVNIAPVDDEFDKKPPPLELALVEQPDFGLRLRKANAALRAARSRATKLDKMLQCDWRTKEVEARALWVRAIGAAIAPV
jgi:tetratricopeptide (TPR) repeat protein